MSANNAVQENLTSQLIFFVNGIKVIEEKVDPEWTLLYYLRSKLGLCGTKLGCGEGGCGACTVMVSRLCRDTSKLQHMAVNACLAPVCSLHGLAVTTVEGIGSTRSTLHPVQERLALSHGSQCGFCTPGIVMSMYALLRSSPSPSLVQLEETFQGNLCRCTGYRPIVEAFRSFVEDWETERGTTSSQTSCNGMNGANGCCGKARGSKNGCCMANGKGYNGVHEVTDQLVSKMKFTPYDASQEAIFPSELQISDALDTQKLVFRGERVTWHRPLDLTELLELKARHPDARLVMGNTEVGLEMKFKQCVYPVLIQPSLVRELSHVRIVPGQGVTFGAAATLSEVETQLRHQVDTQPRHVTRVFSAVLDMLHWFAGKQIRNVGTLAGNIMTSSPISDLNPIFLAANCELKAQSKLDGVRTVRMDHEFFTSYRRNALKPHEVLLSINMPCSSEHQYFAAFKQAKRREDDIAIVNAAFNVHFRPGSDEVTFAALAFGGMAPTTVLAKSTAQMLIGRHWNEETLQMALDSLVSEMTLEPGAPGGVVRYRRSLTLGFFFKFFLMVQQERGVSLQARDISATSPYDSDLPAGSQYFELVPEGQALHDLVGRSTPHLSALKQTTGEAVYCDDVPCATDELFLALVTSTRAHARLLRVDASKALALPGVVAFYSAKYLEPHQNRYGVIVKDEEIFASSKVTAHGQLIGAVVAETQALAQRAAQLVEIDYENLQPVILTLEDAINKNSFFENPHSKMWQRNGDVTSGLERSEYSIEGEVHVGGQEHFYLETQCARAIAGREDDEIHILSSTQVPAGVQKQVAEMLGIPANRVTCKTRRIGGGFGGKETKSFLVALPVALAAKRLGRPVRCMLDRYEDMLLTGGRNPFLGRYSVGFSPEGKIHALDINVFANAGCSLDISAAVVDRSLFNTTNSYKVADISTRGFLCRTNLPSNTSLRGFGSPQMTVVIESIIEDVAAELRMDPELVRARNFYNEGDVTHYGQELVNCTLQRCWDECKAKSDYPSRKLLVQQFNKEHRWRKRGISLVPLTYGIGFEVAFMNQAGALVHIYTDGSVLLMHGGVEMGQGLHTKMKQVASRALGVPEIDIHIPETSTKNVPNAISTAASVSSDLNGMAIVEACKTLMDRLKPYREAAPKGAWKDWVNAAYFDRVSLSTTGFYKTTGIHMDFDLGKGNPFQYFSYGVACSEVEIDCLTGDHQILRTDIVMDLGESLNPAIDVGQVEGAFLQGVGLLTTEELLYSPEGVMLTRGPSTYKIPGFSDAPARFNVTLLRGSSNPRAVYSSKAIGEPPLLLAISVFCAIKGAIAAAREDAGLSGRFRLDSPATSARIRVACADQFIKKIPEPKDGSFIPWNVMV